MLTQCYARTNLNCRRPHGEVGCHVIADATMSCVEDNQRTDHALKRRAGMFRMRGVQAALRISARGLRFKRSFPQFRIARSEKAVVFVELGRTCWRW